MVYKFFDKISSGSGAAVTESNYQLTNKHHKQIIKKFKKRKVHSSFRDNVWGVDLADMHLLRKCKKGIKYLLCAIDLFSKYSWDVSLTLKRMGGGGGGQFDPTPHSLMWFFEKCIF